MGATGHVHTHRKGPVERVVLQPQAGQRFRRGVNLLADTIRPTLGPHPRAVAIAAIMEHKPPELLDEGGLIARRMLELPDRGEDVGAMFLREVLLTLSEQVGDGAATAAVIFQALYNEALLHVAYGVDPVRLRDPLEHGLGLILDKLTAMAHPVTDRQTLARIASVIVNDTTLATLLAEVLFVIGPYGRLEVRGGKRRTPDREYVEGVYWQEGLLTRALLADAPPQARVELQDAAILITNLELEDPLDLIPFMTRMARAGQRRLMIVANRASDGVLALCHANQNPEKFQFIVVKTPHALMPDRATVLHDMSVLVGGRPLVSEAGESIRSATLAHLGQADRVWADQTFFGVAGAKGDRARLEQHIAGLKTAYHVEDDAAKRRKILDRIACLTEGSATLWVGGITELDLELRKNLAARAVLTLRDAITEGVVAGGGTALLSCCAVLAEAQQASDCEEERLAYQLLIHALKEPVRCLLMNAGYDPATILPELIARSPGIGFDIDGGRIADMAQIGLFDPTLVVKAAVYSAVRSASLALTVDTVIHRKKWR